MGKLSYKFKNIFNSDNSKIKFTSALKMLPQKGNLVYEYNPFRNYRLTENKYLIDDKFYSEQELLKQKNIIPNVFCIDDKYYYQITDNSDIINYIEFKQLNARFPKYTNITKDFIYDLSKVANDTFTGEFKLEQESGDTTRYAIHMISGPRKGLYLKVSQDKGYTEIQFVNTETFIKFDSGSLNFKKDLYNKIVNDEVQLAFNRNGTRYSTCIQGDLKKFDNLLELYSAGSCVDFITDELQFDIEHPVDMIPQYSYDGSVNLYINDGKTAPKLINSRFSATGKNTYQIVDRKGDNDTNLYNQGSSFQSDISLYKTANTIAKIDYKGQFSGGQLPCGNYHFYFTYSDADGNETDFFAETGVISVFIGNSTNSIRQGVRNENSNKGVRIRISNLDTHYCYVNIYYSRASGDLYQNSEKEVKRLTDRVFFSSNAYTFNITGFEETVQITEADINPVYQYVQNANTQAFASNMLFLGNVSKTEINYNELQDISLHFLPHLSTSKKYKFDSGKYYSHNLDSYQRDEFIYKFTGYWPDEIYRLGIVYILKDTSLSPVFNIRGMCSIHEYTDNQFTKLDYLDEKGDRQYIEFDQNSFLITKGNQSLLENAKGVVHFTSKTYGETNASIYGIDIRVDDSRIFDYLKQHTLGFFFVRQKRIPTTLCQAQSICVDSLNHHPTVYDGVTNQEIEESFLNQSDRFLSDNFVEHKRVATNTSSSAMLCPDYDVNSAYLNSIFNGQEFTLVMSDFQPGEFTSQDRHFWNKNYASSGYRGQVDGISILGIEDSTPLVCAGNNYFSGVAGVAQMGYKFDHINVEKLETNGTNYIRGIWGPFLGLSQAVEKRTLYDIKIPNYNRNNLLDYFKIRMQDKASYYAIGDRISIQEVKDSLGTFYRGDCYICKFTHRMNRNFNDDTAPYNSKIVNRKTWVGINNGDGDEEDSGFYVTDNVIKKKNFEKINLGDINAVGLGMWVNMYVRSSINLNIRAIDESDIDQVLKTGHGKAFYPYNEITVDGNFKHAEALSYNKGYETSVSTRFNMELPDVPAIKNNFTNRVMYSKVAINDSFVNGNRVFLKGNHQDYSQIYGALTKLVPYNNALIAVFEHGITVLQVNERSLLNQEGNVYISADKVISQYPARILSDTFGSQWKDSILKTPYGLFGVDTVARKIWKTNGDTIECISDFKVQKFLNDNISLTERELTPIIGIRNVKTHYNHFKNDVIFTFYDNLNSVYEQAWSLCFNESSGVGGKFVTFYSWIPSFSENIQNLYFSFDRQTSKWISRLGQCSQNSSYKRDVCLSSVVIPNIYKYNNGKNWFASLSFNFDYNEIESVKIIHDNLGNYKKFKIIEGKKDGETVYCLGSTVDVGDLFSELFERVDFNGDKRTSFNIGEKDREDWIYNIKCGTPWGIYKDSHGQRIRLNSEGTDNRVNPSTIVYYLNLQIEYTYRGLYKSIERQIYFVPEYNMQFLTTDFWKHGQAGIIDIADKIYPTYWYGKQHPFEFEFIVNKAQTSHKIFDNLIIISNKAEPESFHFEVVGDSYDFAEDKPAMYFRQEATEAFYQYHGLDTEYDTNFDEVLSDIKQRPLYNRGVTQDGKEDFIETDTGYVKSTVLPLYYSRRNGYDEIEDSYKQATAPEKNYEGKSGTEIVYDRTLNEYHLWEHVKAIDVKGPGGRLRSNMEYKENMWNVQIPPINIQQKNEPEWKKGIPPILLSNSPTLDGEEFEVSTDDLFPQKLKDLNYGKYTDSNGMPNGIDLTQWESSKQVKPKDRYMKVRVRYSGKKLAIIQSILTLFRVSYA